MKQLSLSIITIALVVASLAGVVYLWWQSTPQFALLQATSAYKNKNQGTFNKYVDVATFISAFTDEIIFDPAEATPNLTKIQRVVGLGAVLATRHKIDNSLIYQVQKLVKKKNNVSCDDDDDNDNDIPLKVVAPPPPGLSKIISQEWKKEKQRLKQRTYDRMLEYARLNNPNTIVHRIFTAPVGRKSTAVKGILHDCGLVKENFRHYQLEHIGPKTVAHLFFYSPSIKNEVEVRLEMERVRDGPLGRYRISRLVNFRETCKTLGQDTDQQVQGLITYGLQDLNKATLASGLKEVIKNIGNSVAKQTKERQLIILENQLKREKLEPELNHAVETLKKPQAR